MFVGAPGSPVDGPQWLAYDNAVAESFNSTLEFELLRRCHFATGEQARHAIAAWIDEYNTDRRQARKG